VTLSDLRGMYEDQQRRTGGCSRPEKKSPESMQAWQRRRKPVIKGRLESRLQAAIARMDLILSLSRTDRKAVAGP
jgi:hypothetical protein